MIYEELNPIRTQTIFFIELNNASICHKIILNEKEAKINEEDDDQGLLKKKKKKMLNFFNTRFKIFRYLFLIFYPVILM